MITTKLSELDMSAWNAKDQATDFKTCYRPKVNKQTISIHEKFCQNFAQVGVILSKDVSDVRVNVGRAQLRWPRQRASSSRVNFALYHTT